MRICTIFVVCFTMSAVSTVTVGDQKNRDQCSKISDAASQIMTARQEGVSMSKMMEAPSEGALGDLLREITVAAYEKSRYSTGPMKQKAVEDFHNDVYLDCIKG